MSSVIINSASYCRVLVLCSVGFLGVVISGPVPPPGGYYTTRYDHIDVENILNQKRLVYHYAECLLDRGPCPPQGIEFKRILPEALRTNCLRCTEKQRFVTYKSIRRLRKEYPDVWAQLAEIWDPAGDYFAQLEQSVLNDKSTNVNLYNNNSPSVVIQSLTTTTQLPKRKTTNKITTVRATIPTSTTSRPVIRSTVSPVSSSTKRQSIDNIQAVINNIESPSSGEDLLIGNRFGDASNEITPLHEQFSSTTRSVIAGAQSGQSPVIFDAQAVTTDKAVTTSVKPVTTVTAHSSVKSDRPAIVTSDKPFVVFANTVTLPPRTTVKRIVISYNNSRPFSRPPGTIATPINNLIRGTNQFLGSITDIASKVIVTGNNFAGMVLSTVQNVLQG